MFSLLCRKLSQKSLVEKQELFRIALTQVMRDLRKQVGLTELELAQKLGVELSWVRELESANPDRTFESVLAYLDALGACFQVSIMISDEQVAVVTTELSMPKQKTDAAVAG
ncbi:MAG: helix-turn-helix domain-containing protein [Hormoscilla sp. SP12CHS1]|nr:helix-turn-helix domain-containing protein [Hormoscilla sp. SP12CHS1]